MIARFIQFCLSQRILVILLTTVITGFGSHALFNLPIDAFPDISPTQVKIIIKSPGMTPEEVESLITQPIEVELQGIPNQTVLRSVTKYALSSITLDFQEGTDIYWARQQVSERLSGIWADLPAGISGGLAPMSTPLSEMFMFTVDNPNLSIQEKRYLLDWTIRPALRTVAGVADVNALGGLVKTYQIEPKTSDMLKLGVSVSDIVAALEQNNQNDGAGRIEQGEEAILVRVEGAMRSLADIATTEVSTSRGDKILLSQVANIQMGTLERYGSVTSNGGEEVVEGLIVGLRGANARTVITALQEKIASLKSALPEGTTLNVFYDRSELIERSVNTVVKALIEAVILVIVVLGVFLGNVRGALTVAIILPLSALFTFLLMQQTHMSANLMSLGGLVIAIGMLVDSSIVIVENIISRLAEQKRTGNPLPRLHIFYRAVKDVALPVVSGVVIIAIVFLPLLTLQGLEGKLFAPVAKTIVYALLGALFFSLTIIPVLASFILRHTKDEEPWINRKLLGIYQPLLEKTLRKPTALVAVAALALIATIALFPLVGKTFMPTMDEGDIIVQLETMPSVNLEANKAIVGQVESALLNSVDEIERIVSRSGSDELGMDPMGLNETDMFMKLKPTNQWSVANKAELEQKIRDVILQFKGLNFGFTQPIDMRVSEMLTGSRGDVAIKLFGSDLETLNQYSQLIAQQVEQIDGSVDTIVAINEGAQYLQVKINRHRATQLGLSVNDIQQRLRAEVEGLQVGRIIEQNARVPLMIRFTQTQGDALWQLQNDFIPVPSGDFIPLSEVAEIKRVEGPVAISREAGQRFAVIRTNVEGRDLVGFVDEARQRVASTIVLPEGYVLTWGGQFENQQRASARLMTVIPVALALIAMLLFMTFRSIKQTLIVLSNIPFAITGGVIALWLTGEFISVPASVGFIALLGIAVMNAVVMVTYFNQLSAQGLDITHVVINGACRRLRPVMMTATTCALGLVPLLTATGPGSEIQKPLAIVVVGGLISSTLLTLFLLPVVYRKFHRKGTA